MKQKPEMATARGMVKLLAFGRIVDIGCYEAHMFGDGAVNVDNRSQEQIREACGKPDLVIPNFVQADAHHLPFKDKRFDCAVISELLEHVEDPMQVMNECQRVANYIVFSVPNEYEWDEKYKPFWNPGHVRFYDEKNIKKLFREAGVKLIYFAKINVQGWSHFVGFGEGGDTPSKKKEVVEVKVR